MAAALTCGFRGWRAGLLRCFPLLLLGGVLASAAQAQTAGLVLSPTSLQVDEGDSASYTVALATQPSDTVRVTITGHAGTDLTLDRASLTFAPAVWNVAQPVTVSVGYDRDHSNESETLVHTASGGGYGSVTANLAVTVTDDRVNRAILVTDNVFTVHENGGTFVQNVWLHSQPTDEVTVTLMVANETVVTVDKTSLTFTTANWGTAQPVTVTGVDDAIGQARSRQTTITLTAAGGDYDGLTNVLTAVAANDDPVPITLPEGVTRTGTIQFVTRRGDGTVVVTLGSSDTDVLTVSPPTLTWTDATSGQAQSFTVTTVDNDALGDGRAFITMSANKPIGPPLPGYDVTVTDNDTGGATVTPTTLQMAKGDTATYTVALTTEPSGDVTVSVASNNTGVATVDRSSLMFPKGDWNTPRTVTVTAVDGGGATVSHGASGGGYDAVPIDSVAVTVSEGLTVTLGPASPARIAEGGEGAEMALTTTGWFESDRVTVELTLGGTAKPRIDYKVQQYFDDRWVDLPIGYGRTSPFTYLWLYTRNERLRVVALSDALTEADETATLTLARWYAIDQEAIPGDVTLSGSASVTIEDATPAVPVVSIAGGDAVTEGGNVIFTLTADPAPAADLPVSVTIGQSGDYVTATDLGAKTVTIGGGQTGATYPVETVDDGTDEADGWVTAAVEASEGYTVADPPDDAASVAVNDNDVAAIPAVSFASASASVGEGSGTRNVAVGLSPAPASALTLNYALSGTATRGSDYSIGGVTTDTGTLTVSSGAATATIPVAVNDDSAEESAETVVLTLTAGSGYTVGSPGAHTLTITDDDGTGPPTKPTVSLSVAPNPVDEGGSVTVRATLSRTLAGSVTVPLVLTEGTAEPGDFGTLESITVAGGQTTGTGAITTAQDADEDDETFTVALSNLPPEVTPGTPSSVLVTIRDDDETEPPTKPTVSLSATPNPHVPEGHPVVVTATLSEPMAGDVTVPLALTAITAEADDFGPLESITIDGGQISGSGTITTTDDADEDNETFMVALGSLPPEVTPGNPSSVMVTIQDDDGTEPPITSPRVILSVAPNPVNEGGSVTVTARLSGTLVGGVTIPLTLTAGTAESGDFGALAGIAVAGGQTEGTGTIATVNDADRDDETFTVALGDLPDGLVTGSPSSVVVTIRDRTPPPNRSPTVTVSCAPCVVPRGGAVRLTATASDPDGDPLTYGWSAASGGFREPVDEPTTTWMAPAEPGRVTIRVEVSDGRGGSASASVVVEVVNRPPAFGQPIYGFELPENLDGRERPVDLGTVSAADPDGDELTYDITDGDRERFAVGTRDGVVRYIGPGEDFETEPNRFALTVRARDEYGGADTVRALIEVTDANEPPGVNASCDPCAVPRGGEAWPEATASDPDGDPLIYAWSAPKGSFLDAGVPVARWKAPAELGPVAIRVVVSDGRGGSASASVDVEVVNRAPAFMQPSYEFELPENVDGRERPADLGRVVATDPDADALTYEIESGDFRFEVGERDGVVRYVGPGENFETEPNLFELTVRALDGFGGEALTEVAVEVTDVNEAPEAADDEAVTPEDQAVTVDVLANDTDLEGDRLRVRSVTAPAHGAARLVSGGRVTYTPEADFHGADSFAYVASDGRGLPDTATVAVTVLPVNDAPTAVGTIPDQTLDEGGEAVEVDLSPFFGDVDGDALTYGARSNDTGVVRASVAGSVLALTPVRYGSATVTVTAWDPAGLTAAKSVLVGVSDRPQRATLGNVLAATARGHLASLRAALGRRMDAGPCEASRLAVMGRSVPLGRTGAEAMLRQRWTGVRSTVEGALGMGGGAAEPFGAMHLSAGRGERTALAAGTSSEGEDRIGDALRSVPARAVGVGGGNGSGAASADFLLGWGGSEEDGERCAVRGRWSLWGQGDVQRFEGTPSVHGHDSGYDGELQTAYVGLDTWLGARWLAGVAFSRSKSVGDWRAGTSEGRLTQFMTAVHPYLRWTGESTSVWASAGTGGGEARNLRAAGRLGTSPTSLRLGLVELEQHLGAPGGLDVAFKGDAAWARLRTGDGVETIDRQDIAVNQVRIGTDLSLPGRLGGADLTPFGTVYARRDGGDGQTGDGVEIAGGLRAVLGIVRLDAQARMLAHHTAQGYGERGAAVTLALGKHGNEEGFSLSVSPRWGDPARATGELLHDPLGGRLRPGGPHPDRWTLDARASYGVLLPGGLKLDAQGSYGGASGGLGLSLSVGMPDKSRGVAERR